MRSPYTYGYSSDGMFTANRPGLELWRGGCEGCGPGGVVNRGAVNMAGVTPVPSGTYMGPIGKTVLQGGMRGYGYSSGPGIPDAVAIQASPTMRAANFMSNLGLATPGQRGALRMSGRGMGDAAQDRALCQGITSSIAAIGTASRDVNRTGDTDDTRDRGWNQAGSYLNQASTAAGAFCALIRDQATPVTPQAQGSMFPPGYYPPPPAPAPAPAMPAWAIPAGIAAAVALVAGIVILKT